MRGAKAVANLCDPLLQLEAGHPSPSIRRCRRASTTGNSAATGSPSRIQLCSPRVQTSGASPVKWLLKPQGGLDWFSKDYFLDPVLELTVPFVEGAAAIVFVFSFFGFFASRLPRCSPLAILASPRVGQECNTCRGLAEHRSAIQISITLCGSESDDLLALEPVRRFRYI